MHIYRMLIEEDQDRINNHHENRRSIAHENHFVVRSFLFSFSNKRGNKTKS